MTERASVPALPVATCCILSGILGNRAFSRRLLEAAESVAPKPLATIWLTADTYQRHPVPWPLRMSDELEADSVFRDMLAQDGLPDAQTYLVNGIGPGIVARHRNPGGTWIVATDQTPLMTDRLRARGYNESPGLMKRAFRSVQSARFHRFAGRVDWWLPRSDACRESLVDDYGVARERCLVTSSPQATVDSQLPSREPGKGPWKLLFVGNDFRRKGGPQLCDALEHLPHADLTIVSRDPEAARFSANVNDRISLVSNVDEPGALQELYRRSHVLVLPTLVDHYSQVICEGLARGLPFVLSEGIPAAELVGKSGAGQTIAWPPTAEGIARAVTTMLEDPVRYRGATERALAFAQARLAREPFHDIVRQALHGTSELGVSRSKAGKV